MTPVAKHLAIPEDTIFIVPARLGVPATSCGEGINQEQGLLAFQPSHCSASRQPTSISLPSGPCRGPHTQRSPQGAHGTACSKKSGLPLSVASQPFIHPCPSQLVLLGAPSCAPVTWPPVRLARSQRGDGEHSGLEPSCALTYRVSLGRSLPL